MKRDWYVEFPRLAEELTKPRKGPRELCLLGGRYSAETIKEFLTGWDFETMPYRIWEYVSRMEFSRDNLPGDIHLLERGRLFGAGGDLSLRRQGEDFAWRFVGPAGIRHCVDDCLNYWDVYPEAAFYEHERTALLWGRFSGERWMEDRVATARLDYPINGERVVLVYKTFSHAGQVEFVWYTGLKEWEGSNNGERDDQEAI